MRPGRIMGVDPGARECGWAWVVNGLLEEVGLQKPKAIPVLVVDALVIEMPTDLWKGTVRDLIMVARGGQRVIDRYVEHDAAGEIVEVSPNGAKAWKAAIKKWTHHKRLWLGLNDDERQLFAEAFGKRPDAIRGYIENTVDKAAKYGPEVSYRANFTHALDALGMAKHHAGVIGRTGAKPPLPRKPRKPRKRRPA